VPVDANVFNLAQFRKPLRQITLIVCNSEEVLAEYANLERKARESGVLIKFIPQSINSELAAGGKSGVRGDFNMIAAAIAESAQDESTDRIFCLLRSKLYGIYEYGSTSCLRNHFHVSLHAPLALGLKASTHWARLRVGDDLEVLDVELGLIKGIDFSISRNPLQITEETYGFSVSPLHFFSIDEVTPEDDREVLNAAFRQRIASWKWTEDRSVMQEQLDTLRSQMSRGADPNQKDDEGWPLLLRAIQNRNEILAQALIEGGAVPNVSNENGLTPLILASANGELEIVKALLARGADVTAKTVREGFTALKYARWMKYSDIEEVLVKAGEME
jgi:hypothetical protein